MVPKYPNNGTYNSYMIAITESSRRIAPSFYTWKVLSEYFSRNLPYRDKSSRNPPNIKKKSPQTDTIGGKDRKLKLGTLKHELFFGNTYFCVSSFFHYGDIAVTYWKN